MWRLLPFLFLLYIVAYLDRINVSFAILQMRGQLHLTDAVYGRAAGMFFAGYFLFQVPSNLLLEKVGVRRWITGLMVSWGAVSCAMIFIRGPLSFYGLRFLLGSGGGRIFSGNDFLHEALVPGERAGAGCGVVHDGESAGRGRGESDIGGAAGDAPRRAGGMAVAVRDGGTASDSAGGRRVLGADG